MKIKDKVLSAMKGKEGKIFQPYEIVDMVLQKYPDTNRSSVLPADCCYNRINKGIKFDFHLFESLDDGSYKYLGPNYQFQGEILWKGKPIGEWKNGKKPPIIFDK